MGLLTFRCCEMRVYVKPETDTGCPGASCIQITFKFH